MLIRKISRIAVSKDDLILVRKMVTHMAHSPVPVPTSSTFWSQSQSTGSFTSGQISKYLNVIIKRSKVKLVVAAQRQEVVAVRRSV